MSTIFQEQYLKNFNNFISQLKVIFASDDTQQILNTINNLSDEDKYNCGMKFIDSFNEENFDLFLKSKIKVFSHKSEQTKNISESLFGEMFCIKNILNNQPDDVKKVIWNNLHTMYLVAELQKPVELQNSQNLSSISKLLNKDAKKEDDIPEDDTIPSIGSVNKKIHDMLGVNINKDTSDMIDEIVGSFEKIMKNKNSSNMISSVMEISKLISVKYADKIAKGEIEIDKLMEAISKKIPGMDKMMEQVIGSMKGEKKKPKEKVVIDENFSTASVNVGEIAEDKKGFNIGGMLKMADQFGVLPGGKKTEGGIASMLGDGGLASLFGGNMPIGADGSKLPNIEKIMGMMKKLDTTTTPEQANDLKNEMDTFLQAELGVDINKLNENLDMFTNKVKDATLENKESESKNS